MLHNELSLIDENWVDLIFAGPTNPQGSERKNRKSDSNKAKQEEMTLEKNKSFRNKRTPRTVFFLLGGKDVISLPYAVEYFVIFAYYCMRVSG